MSELAHNCCIVAVFPETVTATGGALLLAVQGSLCLICAIDWFSGHSGDNAGMTAANTGHQSHDNCQAQSQVQVSTNPQSKFPCPNQPKALKNRKLFFADA